MTILLLFIAKDIQDGLILWDKSFRITKEVKHARQDLASGFNAWSPMDFGKENTDLPMHSADC